MLAKLLILWLLSEGELHGYRVKRILDEPSLQFWFPVEVGSIYAALASLAKSGSIEAVAVEREGLRPERTRYRIRKEGRVHFQELLARALSQLPKFIDPVCAALASESDIEPNQMRAAIDARIQALDKRLASIEAARASAPHPAIADRARALASADLDWSRAYLQQIAPSREEETHE